MAKGVAKWIATRIATKSSTKALTNSQRPTDVIPFLLQIMSSTNTIYVCIYCIVHVYMIHINDCIIVLHRYALSSIYVTSMVSGCKQVVMHWNSGSEPRIYPEMAVQAAKKYSMFSCTRAGYVLLHLPMFFINKMWKNTTKSFLSLLKL